MPYTTEREGQIAFFDNYGIDYRNDNSILIDNTDGIYNGNILEFKLNINNLNKVLFQTIKYLSRMRIKGEDIPATILLIDLNDEKVYQFKSIDYKDEIHKVYTGAASKDNNGFPIKNAYDVYDYSRTNPNYQLASKSIKQQLQGKKTLAESVMPIDIDKYCVVGWAERYYRENPTADKGDFLGDDTGKAVSIKGEIRNPVYFKGIINPYNKPTNEEFKFLMDCLNDRLNRKDLGAFYTHTAYAKKSAELVELAVQKALNAGKKDYIILDRCAGTGNLESALLGLKDSNGDELISHCVVSTYEYYEYKVLSERLGLKVRDIIPPTEADVVYSNGMVSNADAMSEDFNNNPIIKQYVDDADCAIILFENPPYRDISSNNNGVANQQESFVLSEMRNNCSGATLNDLANRFIWSGFNYYIRSNADSYIVFSPIKYWKTCGLANNKLFVKGFLFDRKHFHAKSHSGISCILWNNEDATQETLTLKAYDISDDTDELVYIKDVEIKKAYENFATVYYDKRTFADDEKGICCELNGKEFLKSETRIRVKPIYNENIIAYLRASSYNFDSNSCNLLRCGEYDANGFYIRKDNYLIKLPLFVSKNCPLDKWYEKDIYATTSDGGDAYTKDKVFLKSCLIYTCLSNQNKCLSFNGSDGRYYRNELCFDNTNGDTVASADLAKMKLDVDEQALLDLWNTILAETKATGKCNPDFTYGVYQITKEIAEEYTHEVTDSKGKTVQKPDYPQLVGDLDSLRVMLKEYYKSHITDKMFKYELLK